MKTLLALSALLLLGLVAAGQQSWLGRNYLRLKEECIRIEYTATSGEAALVVEAEIEDDLESLEIISPSGQRMFSMQAYGGLEMAISGFVLESKELDLGSQLTNFPTGRYAFRARTTSGRPVFGKATLYHELLTAPLVLFPTAGATQVPSTGFEILWVADPEAAGYQIVVEQGNSDDLTVDLPPGISSFQVPVGLLLPNEPTFVEVGVIGRNGNRTFTEVGFTTN